MFQCSRKTEKGYTPPRGNFALAKRHEQIWFYLVSPLSFCQNVEHWNMDILISQVTRDAFTRNSIKSVT